MFQSKIHKMKMIAQCPLSTCMALKQALTHYVIRVGFYKKSIIKEELL